MNYEPHEIAQADQTLAGVTHQLGRLVDTIADPHPTVPNVDDLAGLLFVTLGPADLAVTLAVAVHQLAQRDQNPTPGVSGAGRAS